KVSHSPFADDTLIFVVEDDAQNGADHLDAHRSLGYVIGPYVKQGGLVQRSYNTVSMVRTIEDVLALEPMSLTNGRATPMADVFEVPSRPRTLAYPATIPNVLRSTQLPLPAERSARGVAALNQAGHPAHDAAYWERVMAGQNFAREDDLDEVRFNRALW